MENSVGTEWVQQQFGNSFLVSVYLFWIDSNTRTNHSTNVFTCKDRQDLQKKNAALWCSQQSVLKSHFITWCSSGMLKWHVDSTYFPCSYKINDLAEIGNYVHCHLNIKQFYTKGQHILFEENRIWEKTWDLLKMCKSLVVNL